MKYNTIWILAINCLILVLLSSCATKQMNLSNASQEGNLEVVKQLIAEGSQVEEKSENNTTPLMFAAEKGHVDVVSFLLQQGANVNKKNASGFTALAFAMENFHIDVAEVLLQNGADINAQASLGQTVLMRALYQGNKEVILFLMQNGADPNLTDKNGMSSIYLPAGTDDLESLKLLIEHGAKIDVVANNGMTPLMKSAYNCSSKVFLFLMEKEPDINRLTKEGWSALSYAAMGAGDLSKDFDPSIMEQLINAGASVSIKDVKGRSIIELAEIETRYFERKISKKHDEERRKSARGMNEMASANFASAFSNMGLFSSLSVAPRVNKIKAVLDSTKQ
jgi:ankyrin repeat protein